jgi:hypothetical protein
MHKPPPALQSLRKRRYDSVPELERGEGLKKGQMLAMLVRVVQRREFLAH